MKKTIQLKNQVRTGSRAWFADKLWFVSRMSWNSHNPDVCVFSSEGDEISFTKNAQDYWTLDLHLSNVYMLDELKEDLEEFLQENEDEITTDNDIKLELKLKK